MTTWEWFNFIGAFTFYPWMIIWAYAWIEYKTNWLWKAQFEVYDD